MACVIKVRGSRYLHACFRDFRGVQHRRTTKQTERKKALAVAQTFERVAAGQAKRQALRNSISELYDSIYGEALPNVSLRTYTQTWLALKEPEIVRSTIMGYQNVLVKFVAFLGPSADLDISEITRAHLLAFRNDAVGRVQASTVNAYIGALKSLFRAAKRDGYLSEDPSEFLDGVKVNPADRCRRAFTVQEIEALLAVADPEWRSLILFGLYTGQRLGDLVNLRWSNLDLEKDLVSLRVSKTGRQLIIPICPPLKENISSLPGSDDPGAPLHPRSQRIVHAQRSVSYLGKLFSDLLKESGVRHGAGVTRGKGGRKKHALSFHSLRHSFVSLLKDRGVPQAVALELAGHSSTRVSALYTHTGLDALERAVRLLPEFSK